MERLNILRVYDKRCVERWRWQAHHGAFDEQLRFGWLADGRWWLDATWEDFNAWVGTEAECRALLAELLTKAPPSGHRGRWVEAVARYDANPTSEPAEPPPPPPAPTS